jgi:disulfide oxidoreductase YuzD
LPSARRLGDWDEALIVGKNPDGSYVLEYVDEGLIEENVPASRIRLPGADGGDDGGASGAGGGDGSEEAPVTFAVGEAVLGNFKGLGDWDEALVLGQNPDGTYMLEYIDEGLIEKSVPGVPTRMLQLGLDWT